MNIWLLIGLVVLSLVLLPLAGCVPKSEYRDFTSLSELQDWLLENDVSEKPSTKYAEDWYGRALEVQEDALKAGYIVSAVINGKVFYWDPETDEVFEEYYLGTVK